MNEEGMGGNYIDVATCIVTYAPWAYFTSMRVGHAHSLQLISNPLHCASRAC